ncbi:MAG: glycoside hydrolase, partial [Flavisolibacter sp.]|nr:glycoside hydrolase [Flavisolibacter sp.]
MKKSLFLFFFFTGLSLPPVVAQTTQSIAAAKATYSNPLDVKFGDPYVLYTQGMYYMYGTGGGAD